MAAGVHLLDPLVLDHRLATADQLQDEHHDEDDADELLEADVRHEPYEQSTERDTRQHGREELLEQAPVGVLVIGPDPDDVTDDQEQEHRGRRLLGGHELSKDPDGEGGHTTDRRLRDADDERGEDREDEGKDLSLIHI